MYGEFGQCPSGGPYTQTSRCAKSHSLSKLWRCASLKARSRARLIRRSLKVSVRTFFLTPMYREDEYQDVLRLEQPRAYYMIPQYPNSQLYGSNLAQVRERRIVRLTVLPYSW